MGLNPEGKYGPTGLIAQNNLAFVGALTPKVSYEGQIDGVPQLR